MHAIAIKKLQEVLEYLDIHGLDIEAVQISALIDRLKILNKQNAESVNSDILAGKPDLIV